MKRLIKKSDIGVWWDSNLALSDTGNYMAIKDEQTATIYDSKGNSLKEFSFEQIGLDSNSNNEQIRKVFIDVLTTYLSHSEED